jgi:hypothetical protein
MREVLMRTASRFLLGSAVLALGTGVQAQRYVSRDNPDFPRVQYADSLISLNDRCIVRMVKLAKARAPIYVNGLPIAFC